MKRKRIFWTCVLPEDLIGRYGLSFAACNFSFNLMSGGAFDKVFSGMPLYVRGKMDDKAFSDERFELIYDKWRVSGRLLQKLATVKEQISIFHKVPKNAAIWFYNLNTLNAILFILLKVFKPSVQLNVIVLDFTPSNNHLSLNRIYLKLINAAHGRICLANSPLFKKVNSLTLPGVVASNQTALPKLIRPDKSFLLSGVLSEEISMLTMILDAFSKFPDYELHVTGVKGNEKTLKKYNDKYENIHWHGQLPFSEYIDLLHSVTFQLSTRNPAFPENQCNFPSKIIEALLHNRIVVSTISYPQLNGVKYYHVGADSEEFKKSINTIAAISPDELLIYANQGELIKTLFNTDVWEKAMNRIETAD